MVSRGLEVKEQKIYPFYQVWGEIKEYEGLFNELKINRIKGLLKINCGNPQPALKLLHCLVQKRQRKEVTVTRKTWSNPRLNTLYKIGKIEIGL